MAVPYNTGAVALWASIPGTPSIAATVGTAVLSAAARGTAAGVLQTMAALATIRRQPRFIGTGERGPRIRIRRKFSPVYNDIGGPELSFDDLYAGEDAFVFITLTRWNEALYQSLAGTPFPGSSMMGDGPGEIGTAMVTEGAAFPIYLRFPAPSFRPALAAQAYPLGYRFYAASLVDDDDFETGTAANKRHLIFHCRRAYNPANNNLVLGDFNMSGIPALMPN